MGNSEHKKTIGIWTATFMVIANMVGTGIFTSLGFQLTDIHNAFSIAILWIAGGIISLCGAFTYAEIASYIAESGGEYTFLGRIIHPALGFSAGIVSVIIGFSAPIAASCMAFGKYIAYSSGMTSPDNASTSIALALLIFMTIIHLAGMKVGALFQNYTTSLKVLIMILFVVGFMGVCANPHAFTIDLTTIFNEVFSPSFAVSLIYVSYSYSGWNAAAYVAGEIDHPQKKIAPALISGTLIVTILYVMINMVFLYSSPIDALKGNVEVGVISAKYIFGDKWGSLIGYVIAFFLVSAVSSMFIAGPHVLFVMSKDHPILAFANKKSKSGVPYVALLIMSSLATIMILTSSFEWLINFAGITLIVFSTLTVASLFLLRRKPEYKPQFRTPLYPLPPLFFISMNIWILVYVSLYQTSAAISSLTIIICSLLIYRFLPRKAKTQ